MLPLPRAYVDVGGHAARRREAAVRRARNGRDHRPAPADVSQHGALTESRQQAPVMRGMERIGQVQPIIWSAALHTCVMRAALACAWLPRALCHKPHRR